MIVVYCMKKVNDLAVKFGKKDKRRTIQIADAHMENFFSDKPGIWHLISLYWKPGRQNSAIADCNKIN